jgi:hypothetical protein
MYTNEDLNNAVKKEIFTQNSIEEFPLYISKENNTQRVIESAIR